MNRRTLLMAVAGGVGLSGCLSSEPDSSAGSGDRSKTADPSTQPPTSLSKRSNTETPVRLSSDGVEATFRIVDSHRPTDDTASATFDQAEVTVTGTMDPSGCNRPTLTDVDYNATDQVLHLSIGEEAQFGETATVECGNASYDYRCTLVVDSGDPEAVELLHVYDQEENRSFDLSRN